MAKKQQSTNVPVQRQYSLLHMKSIPLYRNFLMWSGHHILTDAGENYFVDSSIEYQLTNRQVEVNLTSGDTYVLGAVGGVAGYLFEQNKQVCV